MQVQVGARKIGDASFMLAPIPDADSDTRFTIEEGKTWIAALRKTIHEIARKEQIPLDAPTRMKDKNLTRWFKGERALAPEYLSLLPHISFSEIELVYLLDCEACFYVLECAYMHQNKSKNRVNQSRLLRIQNSGNNIQVGSSFAETFPFADQVSENRRDSGLFSIEGLAEALDKIELSRSSETEEPSPEAPSRWSFWGF